MVVFGQSEYMSLDNDVTMVLARNRISAAPCSAFSFEKLYAIYSLDECLLLCEVSQKSIRGFSRYLEIFIKRYKLCMPWSLHFMQTNLLLFGCFRKSFISLLFCKLPLYTLQAAERKYTWAIPKQMKTHESGKTQCWALL